MLFLLLNRQLKCLIDSMGNCIKIGKFLSIYLCKLLERNDYRDFFEYTSNASVIRVSSIADIKTGNKITYNFLGGCWTDWRSQIESTGISDFNQVFGGHPLIMVITEYIIFGKQIARIFIFDILWKCSEFWADLNKIRLKNVITMWYSTPLLWL